MSIAIGEVSGIMENHHAKAPLGSSAMGIIKIMVSNSGMVTGIRNCCESVSLSTAEPTAAKSVEYSKYPIKKKKKNAIMKVEKENE